jgi:hypothetical protein
MAEPIAEYSISGHATLEMQRRGIDETAVRAVLAAPDQREAVRSGRDVLRSLIELAGRRYLVRVFVDVERTPAEVVTAYRTSKIAKYWREGP